MKIKSRFAPATLIAFLVILVTLFVGVIVDGREKAKSAEAMSKAAQSFLASLTPEQKATASYSLTDEQRFTWNFTPVPRKGLPLKEMTEAQRKLAMELLKTSLSQRGYSKATSIMGLEPVLAQIEGPARRFPRDPELYFFTVFGDPAKNGDWGWRFEGHHVSQNFTVAKGKIVIDAPSFYGTNPAEVLADVPQKGLRVLGAEEDLGRALIKALDDKQRKVAIYDEKAPGDIITMNQKDAKPLDKVGIKANALNGKQFAMLEKIVEEYLGNVTDDVAAARRAKFKSAKKDEIYFAWSGPIERTDKTYKLDARDLGTQAAAPSVAGKLQGHYYRIQAPSFLIEYDNTQNNANHIHSVWRDFNGDWGRDLLAEHYRATDHSQKGE